MATSDRNNNNVVARDQRGRWLKGFSGGPGRPLGSRNKLTEEFLADLYHSWQRHGRKVLDRVMAERPEVYFQAMIKLAQVHRVELDQPDGFERARTKEEVLAKVEERTGAAGRALFEDFVRQLEALETAGVDN